MATRKSGAAPAPLDPKVADRLLDLLGTDNAFRRLFKQDPQAALAKAGHPEAKAALAAQRKGPPFQPPGPPPTVPPPAAACLQVQRIAPKAQIVKARAELRLMLTSGLNYIPQKLEASAPATSARRSRK